MKRKLLLVVLTVSLLFSLTALSASADMGPKPSVRVTFDGLGDGAWYGTLLSSRHTTGPYSVWDGEDESRLPEDEEDRAVFLAMHEYRDADGYYFLCFTDSLQDGVLSWTYYPPSVFKILLYNADTGELLISGVYERYAFESYYTALLTQKADGTADFTVNRSDRYLGEVALSFLGRVVLTLAVELGIALLFFGVRDKKRFAWIAGVNVVTQVILNLLLSVTLYLHGYLSFLFSYFVWEALVVVLEAVAYAILLPRVSQGKLRIWRPILYALVANAVSFAVGILVAEWIPALF